VKSIHDGCRLQVASSRLQVGAPSGGFRVSRVPRTITIECRRADIGASQQGKNAARRHLAGM
jgi:hypothetical protein